MRDLPNVTLACVDTANHALALRALGLSRRSLQFARTIFLTDGIPVGTDVPSGIEVRPIAPLASRDDYSRFVLKSLLRHIDTPHVLLIQWDGYVVNPAAFDPLFLCCDYIGAKWFWFDDGMRVGNGGFSLRSHRLLEALQDKRIDLVEAEDITIGRAYRPLLEREYGIRYADDLLADRFAFEAAYPTGLPFGFHGLYNFCRVVSQDELSSLAQSFSDAIARSLQLGQLLRNCIALGQCGAAAALARRRLAAMPDDQEAKVLLARAETGLAGAPAVSRNDPCPCGSGKRYKQCHGALGATALRPLQATAPIESAPSTSASPPFQSAPTASTGARSKSALSLAQQGVAAHRRGDIDSAERAYGAALRVDPEQPLAMHYLGVVLFQRMRFTQALPLLARSTERIPGEPEFHNNLGLALAALDRNEEAIDAYRRALALAPSHATASNNLGLAMQASNRVSEAIDAYRHALAIAPDFAHAHWNLALALLVDGQYEEGWREYEWRLRLPELGGRAPALPVPRWNGENLHGRTLLVSAEQGIGDALQFIRFARPVAARGIRIVVRAPASLCPLLASVPGVASTLAADAPLPACDAEIPMLSLARILDVRPADIDGAAYMSCNRELRTGAARRIAATGSGKRNIGLAWAGAPHHLNDRRRSISPEWLAPLFELPDIAWFSLQRGPREQAIAQVPTARAMARLDPDTTLQATAALIDTLDAVVTVDTSIAHLAGALGKPVFVMLPFAPDWRWGLHGVETPWYSSARLFRQRAIGDWGPVIADVARALSEW
jgi:tetratricopeptide (TPR) repeat protein